MTNSVVLTDGTHTFTATNHSRVEPDSPANVAEVPIPGRTTGGQIQYLGSPQWKFTVNDILNQLTGGTDDLASFQPGGGLELMKNNTGADTTITWVYNNTTVLSAVTVRILDFTFWPIAGAAMPWFSGNIKLVRKQ
jgi:hypothetical protein